MQGTILPALCPSQALSTRWSLSYSGGPMPAPAWGTMESPGEAQTGPSSGAHDSFVPPHFGAQLLKYEARSLPLRVPIRQRVAGVQGRQVLGPTPKRSNKRVVGGLVGPSDLRSAGLNLQQWGTLSCCSV